MSKGLFSKYRVFATIGLSFTALAVTLVSTVAWFQISQRPLGTSITTGTKSTINAGNVTGYKTNTTTDENGYITNETSAAAIDAGDLSGTNASIGGKDTNFDIPDHGDGYYFVQANSVGEFHYYNPGTVKLDEYTPARRVFLDDCDFASGDTYRLIHYTNISNTTHHDKISIDNSENSAGSPRWTVTSGDITFNTDISGLRMWINHSNGKIEFEDTTAHVAEEKNRAQRKPGVKKAGIPSSDPAANKRRIYCTNNLRDDGSVDDDHWKKLYCYAWGGASGQNAAWPGAEMTFSYTNDAGEDVYYSDIPSDATSLIFNNGHSNDNDKKYRKTQDITDVSSDGYYIQTATIYDNGPRKYGTWTPSFYKVYFYNKYNGNNLLSSPVAYAVTNKNSGQMGGTTEKIETFGSWGWSGAPSLIDESSLLSGLYSIELPTLRLGYYQHIIFRDSSSQSTDLTNVNTYANQYWQPSGDGAGFGGTWKTDLLGSDTYTYYCVDIEEKFGNETVYAYITNSEGKTYINDEGNSKHQMSGSNRVYSVTVNTAYDRVKFTNSSETISTATVSVESGKYYEIIDGSGTSLVGRWTVGAARTNNNRTYYLLDQENVFNGTAYCHGWSSKNNSSTDRYTINKFPGIQMQLVSTTSYTKNAGSTTINAKLYSVSVSGDYDMVVFSDGTNKTADLTVPTTNSTKTTFDMESNRSGVWRSAPNGNSPRTYYLYDVDNTFNGGNVYVNAWDSANNIYSLPPFSGVRMTQDNNNSSLYSITVSQSYNRIQFSNGSSSNQTGAITVSSSTNGKYFVMKSNKTGNWYNGISTVSTTNNVTYALYDKANNFIGANTPKIYAYLENNLSGNDSILNKTFYYGANYDKTNNYCLLNTTFNNSPSMTQVQQNSVNVPGLWEYATISESFTHIMFIAGSNETNHVALTSAALATNYRYFILSGTMSNGRYDGTWQTQTATIIKYAVYYIIDESGNYHKANSTTFPTELLEYDTGTVDVDFTASCSKLKYFSDEDNGIWYEFSSDGTWYTNAACTEAFGTNATATLTNVSTTLYGKYVCDMRNMKTFYVDVTDACLTSNYHWDDVNVYAWNATDSSYNNARPYTGGADDTLNGGVAMSEGTNFHSNFKLKIRVAPDLYQFTVPNSCSFRFNWYKHGNTNGDYGENYSNQISSEEVTAHSDGDMIYMAKAERIDLNSLHQWSLVKHDNIGTATIYVNNAGSGVNMVIGDLTNNYFIYERGIDLDVGDSIEIRVTGVDLNKTPNLVDADGDDAFEYADLNTGSDGTTADFLYHDGDDNFVDGVITFKVKGRYTFYLIASGKLAIAKMPGMGNGFFIMPSNDAGTLNTGFEGAIKMRTISDTEANYEGFIAHEGEKFFIRSYMNGIEKLYDTSDYIYDTLTYGVNGDITSISNGVITFGNPAKYSFVIDSNGKVTITKFSATADLVLNPLNPNASSVKDGHSSLVLQIEFTIETTQSVNVGIDIDNPYVQYLGFIFCVSKSPLSDPYVSMRTRFINDSSLQTGTSFVDTSVSFSSEDGNDTYYAYLLIDYIRLTNIPSDMTTPLNFYLKTVQAQA